MTAIGLLCHHTVGGSVRAAVALSEQLARRGHDVHLFARAAPLGRCRFADGVRFHGLGRATRLPEPAAHWPVHELRDFTALVVRVTRDVGLEVLHYHYALPFAQVGAGVRRAAGRLSPAIVGTLHGTDVPAGRGTTALRRSLASADTLTTVSSSHAWLARRAFGLDPVVIPNFVDLEEFRPRPQSTTSPRRLRVAHLSNFRPVKNAEAVARIFGWVRRHVDAELWLVGDGATMPDVRAALDGQGLSEDISFFGVRSDVQDLLPGADVLLVTSRSESFCLAALEAQACGVPVVAPRVGGIPEVVVHGESGLLYPRGDEEAATRAVVGLLRSQALRHRLGGAGRRLAQRFDAARVVPCYERLYADLLRHGRAAAGIAP